MKLNSLLILIFLIPFHAKSDQIYELIKIPNLKLYKTDDKDIRFLIADKNFSAGVGINSVNCEKSEYNKIKSKFYLTKKNIDYYSKDFLKKINLKFIILCKNLTISDIPAIGFANPEMKTIILNINSNEEIFQRVIHHEIFHIIHKNFESHFNEVIWSKFNNPEFKYSQCSTCKKDIGLNILSKTNGFFTKYAKTNVSEDMAETFSFIVINNEHIQKKIDDDLIIKNKTIFIKENVLNIYENFKF